MVRRRIVFSGRVQGVGFRYRAKYAAADLALTGWVKNDWDGTVLMEVQGEEEAIDRLILFLRSERFIRITDVQVTNIPLKSGERSFAVKGY